MSHSQIGRLEFEDQLPGELVIESFVQLRRVHDEPATENFAQQRNEYGGIPECDPGSSCGHENWKNLDRVCGLSTENYFQRGSS